MFCYVPAQDVSVKNLNSSMAVVLSGAMCVRVVCLVAVRLLAAGLCQARSSCVWEGCGGAVQELFRAAGSTRALLLPGPVLLPHGADPGL